MERIIARVKPKYDWIIVFILGAVSMYTMLSYSQLLTTGKYTVVAGDSLEIGTQEVD